MISLIVCVDDVCPKYIQQYWGYWESIKREWLNLKLNAFVVPHWFYEGNEAIVINNDFKNWYQSVKGWVDLHLHGFAHTYPPEGLLAYAEQKSLYEHGRDVLKTITDKPIGFRPPGFHYNKDTILALKDLNFPFICLKKQILNFKNETIIDANPPLNFLNTHLSDSAPDAISKIYKQMKYYLRCKTSYHILDILNAQNSFNRPA